MSPSNRASLTTLFGHHNLEDVAILDQFAVKAAYWQVLGNDGWKRDPNGRALPARPVGCRVTAVVELEADVTIAVLHNVNKRDVWHHGGWYDDIRHPWVLLTLGDGGNGLPLAHLSDPRTLPMCIVLSTISPWLNMVPSFLL